VAGGSRLRHGRFTTGELPGPSPITMHENEAPARRAGFDNLAAVAEQQCGASGSSAGDAEARREASISRRTPATIAATW
jgi:hypothetical protein